MKLLYAEDEVSLSEAVCDILTYHNFIVDAVYDGADALYYALNSDYDGIILDIMMPKKDGISVLSELRAKGIKTPVLLLTAKSQVEDKITGLDFGADDYLSKPFDMGERLMISVGKHLPVSITVRVSQIFSLHFLYRAEFFSLLGVLFVSKKSTMHSIVIKWS